MHKSNVVTRRYSVVVVVVVAALVKLSLASRSLLASKHPFAFFASPFRRSFGPQTHVWYALGLTEIACKSCSPARAEVTAMGFSHMLFQFVAKAPQCKLRSRLHHCTSPVPCSFLVQKSRALKSLPSSLLLCCSTC